MVIVLCTLFYMHSFFWSMGIWIVPAEITSLLASKCIQYCSLKFLTVIILQFITAHFFTQLLAKTVQAATDWQDSYFFTVRYLERPVFDGPLENQTVTEGSNVTLVCRALSDAAVVVYWLRIFKNSTHESLDELKARLLFCCLWSKMIYSTSTYCSLKLSC